MRRRTISRSGTLTNLMLVAVSLLVCFPLSAQAPSAPAAPAAGAPTQATPVLPQRPMRQQTPPFAPRRRQKPCWQQAGVTLETYQKIGVIRENTRTQIVTACGDASLSHQQKLDKIAEVRKSANKERDTLIPARQLAAIHQCEASRPRPRRLDRRPSRSEDPCAGSLPGTPAATPADDAPPGQSADPKKPDSDSPPGDAADPKN